MKIEDWERLTHERGQEVCELNGYKNYTRFSGGRDAAIWKLGFTHAIISDLTECYVGDRWCYHNYIDAFLALLEWQERDGEGEPTGWHRHPDSGRRRENGDPATEYINP